MLVPLIILKRLFQPLPVEGGNVRKELEENGIPVQWHFYPKLREAARADELPDLHVVRVGRELERLIDLGKLLARRADSDQRVQLPVHAKVAKLVTAVALHDPLAIALPPYDVEMVRYPHQDRIVPGNPLLPHLQRRGKSRRVLRFLPHQLLDLVPREPPVEKQPHGPQDDDLLARHLFPSELNDFGLPE